MTAVFSDQLFTINEWNAAELVELESVRFGHEWKVYPLDELHRPLDVKLHWRFSDGVQLSPIERSPARILVADDHPAMRRGIRALLETKNTDWQICGEASTGAEVLQKAQQLSPDIIMLDIYFPDMTGYEVLHQIRKNFPQVRVLVLSVLDAETNIREMLANGAWGYVLKSDDGLEIISALKAVLAGKPFLSRQAMDVMLKSQISQTRTVLRRADDEPASELTPRQLEIVRYLANGRSNKEVANELSISVKTVEAHRAQIMHRLRLRSVSELVRYALRSGIVKD